MKENRGSVLIISREFIPYASSFGGVVRMVKLADYLVSNNFQVYTLSGKGGQPNYYGYESVVDKINCYYVTDKMQDVRRSSSFGANGLFQKIKFNVLKNIRKAVEMVLVPDLGVLYVPAFFRSAINLIKKYRIKNIIVTSPVPSNLLVGYFLKIYFKDEINFIIDYRDSWNTTAIFKKNIKVISWISSRLEKKVLSSCDHFVYVTPAILDKVTTEIMGDDILLAKSSLIRNGYDGAMLRAYENLAFIENECLTIGYFGAIDDRPNSFRNPKKFLEAFESASQKLKLKICFFGKVNIGKEWNDRLGDNMIICGNLNHSEAMKKMNEMDVLLVIHTEEEGADEVMPGKIYEYITTGKPLLSIGPHNLEVSKFVNSNRLGYTSENEVLSIEKTLLEIHSDWLSSNMKAYDSSLIKQYDRSVQYKSFLNILDR